MPFDEEPDDDPERRAPLPPEDRIWRHPSELGAAAAGAGLNPGSLGARPQERRPRRTWALVGGSALAGAAATVAVLVGLGTIGDGVTTRVVEQVLVPAPQGPDNSESSVGEQAYATIAKVLVDRPGGATYATAAAFRSDGYLLTTADAVADSRSITVTLADGTELPAELVGADISHDIAVIRVEVEELPTATLATASDVNLTDRVIALSAGESWPEAKDVKVGVVSAVNQRVIHLGEILHGMLRAHVDLSGPATGSVLLATNGAVVGIVTGRGQVVGDSSVVDTPSGSLDTHHATPIAWAKHIADELVSDGRPTHVWVGIEGADLPEEEANQNGGKWGAKVRRVVEDSPAEAADLREGDIVTAVDDRQVTSMSDLVVLLRPNEPGAEVKVQFQRDGADHTTTVLLAERP